MTRDTALRRVGVPTGVVLATPDADGRRRFFEAALGCEPTPHAADGSARASLSHPDSAQVVTFVEAARPNPAMALAVRCEALAAAVAVVDAEGFATAWTAESDDGTRFAMCVDAAGVALLLYQPPG